MLHFSRWKATAILLTVFVTCLFVVPDFIAQGIVQSWPAWAQHRLVLGLDLQGGSHLLLQVGDNAVRLAAVGKLADDTRRAMREAHIPYSELTTKPDGVELSVKDADLQRALDQLRQLSQPLAGLLARTGERSAEIV